MPPKKSIEQDSETINIDVSGDSSSEHDTGRAQPSAARGKGETIFLNI
jgi:hypothetical protein